MDVRFLKVRMSQEVQMEAPMDGTLGPEEAQELTIAEGAVCWMSSLY